jgi:catechol 2,3-dioxygenase-like lactoylglutathione lyase family enzyme
MAASVNHHIGLRVADLERSARFYQDAFGARMTTQPMTYGPPDAGEILAGPPELTFRVCHLGFDDGTIELFELGEPHQATEPIPATSGGIIHYAIEVDDVPAALERVERAGGRRLWTDLRDVGASGKVIYATDPDGHVLELIDLSIGDLVDVINEAAGSGGAPPGLAD